MGRAPCCDKANVKKGPWSPEEDAKLKAYIENYGTGGNWIALPQKIGLKRCGKSCRLRWLNYLRPNIKHGGFSEEEDNLICSLYISIGSRWSIIAAQLPGRTDNDIKNYWNTRLKKKLLGRRKQSNTSQLGEDPRGGYGPEEGSASLSNSAMERLQLHMQLQNPFSFYNNPALWPNKLHPLQEKAIQSLHALNGNNSPNFSLVETSLPNPQEGKNLDTSELPAPCDANMPRIDNHMLSPMCAMPKPDVMGQSGAMSFQAELDNFLGNRSVGSFMGQEGHGSTTMAEQFDCLRDLNMMLWANELDTKSTSSNSWDSNPGLQSDQGMLQDYVLGYNL